MTAIVETLLASSEPSIRFKTRARLLGESPSNPAMTELRKEIRHSERVRRLLSERGPDGTIPHHPYFRKWTAPIGCWLPSPTSITRHAIRS